MKRAYHIVFKENATDHMSKGKNYIENGPRNALTNFMNEYPNGMFITMYDLNALADIRGGAMIEVVQDGDRDLNQNFEDMYAGDDTLLNN